MKIQRALLPGILAFSFALLPSAVFSAETISAAPVVSSYAPVVDRVAPSVVTVYSSKTVKRDLRASPFFNDPMFRRFFGEPNGFGGQSGKQQGLGSGVIVSSDGYVLTNNHVIEGADEIFISLDSGSREYKATKVGADPRTDLALLKIDAKDLVAASFADSDKLRAGDVVLAIGNPFGLRSSVSLGIVSAIGRGGMGITDYENFIQTDASINPGNSGGALIDVTGNVVGINTAIFSRSGGNQGIGFAVPANLARDVMEKLRAKGRVVRGYIGIKLQPLTHDLMQAFNLQDDRGALVAEVLPDTPAGKAGLENGDIIVALNDKPVADSRQLQFAVGTMNPGDKVKLKVLRKGSEKSLTVELAELPGETASAGAAGMDTGENPNALDGITVGDIDAQTRQQFEIPASVKGALITNVEPDSAGADAGLRVGDVIQEINREPVSTADEAVAISNKIKKGQTAVLRLNSRGSSRYVVVNDK